jgi:hypothetical protein
MLTIQATRSLEHVAPLDADLCIRECLGARECHVPLAELGSIQEAKIAYIGDRITP